MKTKKRGAYNPYRTGKMLNWEDIPCIQVQTLLLKTKWFTGKAILDRDNKDKYEKGGRRPLDAPNHIDIEYKYRNVFTRFSVSWCEAGTFPHFEIGQVKRPVLVEYAFTPGGAVNAVRKTIGKIMPMLREEAQKKEEAERVIQYYKSKKDNVSNALGVETEYAYTNYNPQPRELSAFEYRNSKDFAITMRFLSPGYRVDDTDMKQDERDDLYLIESIQGYFRLEDIKRFCMVLASSTTAVSARLK
jgi:hypothetical protein